MPKQKSLSQLKAERAACEQRLAQLQHKVQQYENRIAYDGIGFIPLDELMEEETA